jgi:glutamine amidotransferase
MTAPDIAIVDGGGANIASLVYALDRLGANSRLTADPADIAAASHVILPGVGAAAAAMDRLERSALVNVLAELAQPVLGICLGMQLLCAGSAEDDVTCIGVFDERAERLDASPASPVPNMGWCEITVTGESPLLEGIDTGAWFYFIHSFAIPVSDSTLATATHTGEFSAIMGRENYFATQFHPERSSASGARLLSNFLALGR